MVSITAELHKVIDEQKKRLAIIEKRIEERHKLEMASFHEKEQAARVSKEEEEGKRGRRRPALDKSFRGCTEDDAEEDLLAIFNGVKADKYIHTLPDGRAMAVIKKNKIVEGDLVRIEKGEAFEVGVVKCLHKGMLILECKDREKKYPIVKLLSTRYTITPQRSRSGSSLE